MRYVEWLKRIKGKLEREERIKQKDEERKKREDEEKKQNEDSKKQDEDDIPYRKDIENCELLLSYCISLKPQEEKQ